MRNKGGKTQCRPEPRSFAPWWPADFRSLRENPGADRCGDERRPPEFLPWDPCRSFKGDPIPQKGQGGEESASGDHARYQRARDLLGWEPKTPTSKRSSKASGSGTSLWMRVNVKGIKRKDAGPPRRREKIKFLCVFEFASLTKCSQEYLLGSIPL